jgi:valyl-tRNA synthetase
MPFITEELWHLLRDRKEGDDIIIAAWPKINVANDEILKAFPIAAELIGEIRNFRQSKGLSPKEALALSIRSNGSTCGIEDFWGCDYEAWQFIGN